MQICLESLDCNLRKNLICIIVIIYMLFYISTSFNIKLYLIWILLFIFIHKTNLKQSNYYHVKINIGLSYPNPYNNATILLENKYFSETIPVIVLPFNTIADITSPYAVVIIYNQDTRDFLTAHSSILEASECNILFNESSDEAENISKEFDIEFICDNLEEFKGMNKENGEMIGVGRIKEAIECAVASFVTKQKKPEKKNQNKEVTAEEMEKDMEDFEYFLNKIKENCDHSKNVDGETRKKNAEETINELIHYLQLNEDKEDDEDII